MSSNASGNICTCCGELITQDFLYHKRLPKHIFNFYVWAYKRYRKTLKNVEGIKLTIKPLNDANLNSIEKHSKGVLQTKIAINKFIERDQEIKFKILITNDRKEEIYITSVIILDDNQSTFWEDANGNLNQPIKSKQTYDGITLTFRQSMCTYGSFKIPVAINFETTEKSNKPVFSIWRTIVVAIKDNINNVETVQIEPSPFTRKFWFGIECINPPLQRPPYRDFYPIPDELSTMFKTGFKEWPGMNISDWSKLAILKQDMSPGYVTRENFVQFFHNCLWLEEAAQELMLEQYNMENVTFEILGKELKLRVPGLAEKRPSLVPGDLISIRVHDDTIVYQGFIRIVEDQHILIKDVDTELREIVRDGVDKFDVSYQLGRLSFERAHHAIDLVVSNHLLNLLFPSRSNFIRRNNQISVEDGDLRNQNIRNNREQKTAIKNIVNCTSGNAPYIVFGPPGTGKTVTIVEAIYQILKKTSKKILVCAPANAACDMLILQLKAFCDRSVLIRLHTQTRDVSQIPEEIYAYSNIDSKKQIQRITGQEISKYRIVVSTLIFIGGYHKNSKYCPDYVFIDEAAQATEPDTCVAVSFMQANSSLVLAGDPKQLGPTVMSKVCQKYHLDKSLLRRLTEENELYNIINENTDFISMLKDNFRSHSLILQIPNKLFYEGLLRAKAVEPLNDPISKMAVYPRIPIMQNALRKFQNLNINKERKGCAIEFCAISSKEKREGRSPSYYNPMEAAMAIEYIKAIVNANIKNKVLPSEIGIVTPYIRQMYRLKQLLQQNGFKDVEVGTTEAFQGREKRVILISTVRAQHSLLRHDRKYDLGFVGHKERFNVAVTRAKSKLIIIGCPMVLGTDEKFLEFIALCEEHGSYYGAPYERRTDKKIQSINQNFQASLVKKGKKKY